MMNKNLISIIFAMLICSKAFTFSLNETKSVRILEEGDALTGGDDAVSGGDENTNQFAPADQIEFVIPASTYEEGDEKYGFKIYDDELPPLCYCNSANDEGLDIEYSGVRVHNNRLLTPNFKSAICVPKANSTPMHYLDNSAEGGRCSGSMYCVNDANNGISSFVSNAGENNQEDSCVENFGCGYVEPICGCPPGYATIGHPGNHDPYITVNESHGTYVYKALYCRRSEYNTVDDDGNVNMCKRGYSCQLEEEGAQVQSNSEGICVEGYVCTKLRDVPEVEEEEPVDEEPVEEEGPNPCECQDSECAKKNKRPSVLNLRLKRFGKLRLNIDTKENVIINIKDDCCQDVCRRNVKKNKKSKCGCGSGSDDDGDDDGEEDDNEDKTPCQLSGDEEL